MRGVIESFDSATGLGTIRGKDGTLYPFASTDLVRRSKPPHASARVVFRLKDGKIFRAAVGPDQRQRNWGWDMAFWPWEWLLYIP
jgi:hypothetical protein